MNSAQKVIKYLAIALAVLLIVSIFTGIYRIGGMVLGSIVNHTGEGLNIDKYSDDANILSIDVSATDLIIKPGKELKVEVKNNKHIKTKQINNKLAITEKSVSFRIRKTPTLIVYIPEDIVFDEVYIGAGAGKVTIDKLNTEKLNFQIGAGKVEMQNINVLDKTLIDGGTGKVTIKKSNFKNLKLDAGVGKFNISSILNGKSKIEAGIGELNIELLDSKSNYTIKGETGIGAMKIDGKKFKNETKYGKGENTIEIEGGIGKIDVTFKK